MESYHLIYGEKFCLISSKKIEVSLYALWNGRKPNFEYLKVCGCVAFYIVPDPKGTKLGQREIKSIFL